jgi:hypothetical protein
MDLTPGLKPTGNMLTALPIIFYFKCMDKYVFPINLIKVASFVGNSILVVVSSKPLPGILKELKANTLQCSKHPPLIQRCYSPSERQIMQPLKSEKG